MSLLSTTGTNTVATDMATWGEIPSLLIKSCCTFCCTCCVSGWLSRLPPTVLTGYHAQQTTQAATTATLCLLPLSCS